MIEELGGKFLTLARPAADEDKVRYCSVFGKPGLVERAKGLLPSVGKMASKSKTAK